MITGIPLLPYYQVIDFLDGFIRNNSYSYFEWFVGLAENPEKKVIEDHRINPRTDIWTYQEVPNTQDAVKIKEYFLNMGCVGGILDSSGNNCFIYIYRRSSTSSP